MSHSIVQSDDQFSRTQHARKLAVPTLLPKANPIGSGTNLNATDKAEKVLSKH
jgi:hypothetical protein